MTSRMLTHVSIRESLEGAGGRLDAIFAFSLDRVDAASDLAPKLETTFSSHLQADRRVAANGCARHLAGSRIAKPERPRFGPLLRNSEGQPNAA
jgi:hypothetical protein